MSPKPTPDDKDQIVVGSPLPFSVYSAEGELLLAEGNVVQSENTQRLLLRKGVFRDIAGFDDLPPAPPAPERAAPAPASNQPPLVALQKDYGAGSAAHRFALSIASSDSDEAYNAWVIGVHNRNIIVSAPRRPNGALVGAKVGQVWLCRALQMTSAFRFRSTVLKVVFEPFPHVYLEAPQHVERRTVRSRPRAAVFVPSRIETPRSAPAVMVDLSVTGGRMALERDFSLEPGDELRIAMRLEVIDSDYELSLKARVAKAFGASDGRHPRVNFYGIQFDSPTEVERLVLHGFVSGQLAMELNSLWQLLSMTLPVSTEPAAQDR